VEKVIRRGNCCRNNGEFIVGIEDAALDLEQNIRARNIKAVQMMAHQIKGLCLNLYGNEQRNLLLQFEHDAANEDWQSIESDFQSSRKILKIFSRYAVNGHQRSVRAEN